MGKLVHAKVLGATETEAKRVLKRTTVDKCPKPSVLIRCPIPFMERVSSEKPLLLLMLRGWWLVNVLLACELGLLSGSVKFSESIQRRICFQKT